MAETGRSVAAPTLDDVPKGGAATGAGFRGEPGQGAMLLPRLRRMSEIAAPTNGNQLLEPTGEEARSKRLNPIKRKQMEVRVQELEEEIARVEAAIAHCETGLQNFVSAEESQRQSQELNEHKAQHVELIRNGRKFRRGCRIRSRVWGAILESAIRWSPSLKLTAASRSAGPRARHSFDRLRAGSRDSRQDAGATVQHRRSNLRW